MTYTKWYNEKREKMLTAYWAKEDNPNKVNTLEYETALEDFKNCCTVCLEQLMRENKDVLENLKNFS